MIPHELRFMEGLSLLQRRFEKNFFIVRLCSLTSWIYKIKLKNADKIHMFLKIRVKEL